MTTLTKSGFNPSFAQSLEESFIIAQNHTAHKRFNPATNLKTFFNEKWVATKSYPQAGANKVKTIFDSIYAFLQDLC